MAPHFLHIHVKGNPESASTNAITATVTRTIVRWVEQSSTLRRVVSRSQLPVPNLPIPTSLSNKGKGKASPNLSIRGNQLPTQGIPPATTLSTVRSHPLTSRPQNLPALTSPTPPSYPLTLFDYRAITLTAPDNTLASLTHTTPNTMEGYSFQLPAIPLPAIIALFTCLSLALLWSLLVILINTLPPPPPPTNPPHRPQPTNPPWWKKLWGHSAPQRNRKPLDKPSKYAHQETSRTASSNEVFPSAKTSTAMSQCQDRDQSIRLRRMNPPPAPLHPPWAETGYLNEGTSASSSPVNPYLPAVVRPQGSSEYVAAHGTFVGTTSQVSGLDGVDGLEAQEGERMRRADGSDGMEKGAREWVGAVEGGVSRVVERVVRWMGEGDGELLLPVGEGKR